MNRATWAMLSAGVLLAGPLTLWATEAQSQPKAERTFRLVDSVSLNAISFTSSAPLEDINGLVQGFTGSFTLDPKDLSTLKGQFSVKVADMKTGIALRDEHLQSAKWLDAAKFPTIDLVVSGVEGAAPGSDGPAELTLVGKFTLHGVTRDVKIPARVAYMDETDKTRKLSPGNLVRVRAEFSVKLADYEIAVGEATIGQKVAEEIRITVSCVGTDAPPPPPVKVDQ